MIAYLTAAFSSSGSLLAATCPAAESSLVGFRAVMKTAATIMTVAVTLSRTAGAVVS